MDPATEERLKKLETDVGEIGTKLDAIGKELKAKIVQTDAWWQRIRRNHPLATQNVLFFAYGPLLFFAGWALGHFGK